MSSGCKRFLRYIRRREKQAILVVRSYLQRSKFRGFRFLVDSKVACWERVIWFGLIVLGAFCVISMSSIISIRYNANYLTTVIDNRHYSVASIPFPAVTLCHFNRIDSRKVDAAIKRFLPNSSPFEQKNFRALLQRMNGLRFGSFSKLARLREHDFRSLDHLNLSELYQSTAYACGDLLRECWWRSRAVKCCELFIMSKSEYGFCYSFNSQTAPMSQYEKEHADLRWPLQTYRFGLGTGLRVLFRIDLKGYREFDREAGVTVIVHANGEWPTSGRFVPTGASVSVAVEPSVHKTSKKLRAFSPEDRQCLFDDRSITESAEVTDDVMHLKDLPYLKANCLAECRRYYMMKFCNCSVDFFYPEYGYPPCTITGLQCLSYLNPILTYERPKIVSSHFPENEVGINCKCLPECIRVEYKYSVKENFIWPTDNVSMVDISVFFKRQEMIRYHTEKAYQFMTLLANFGGIFSFFFGASMLSGFEMAFFIIKNAVTSLVRWKENNFPRVNKPRSNANEVLPVHTPSISTLSDQLD